MKKNDLESHLKKHGCTFKRHGGGHDIWENRQGAISSIPRHTEIKNNTVRKICKQLEVPSPI